MECTIDILPREVLHNVFSKLSIPDRLNAAVVCKKWLEVLNCKSSLKNITVLINNNNTVPVFSSMNRNFLNFSFKLIIVDYKYYDLFKRFSSHIEYLSFENCEVWKREHINFDDLRYDNLKVLRIIDCDLWKLFPYLPNLRELYLTVKKLNKLNIEGDNVISRIFDEPILNYKAVQIKSLNLFCKIDKAKYTTLDVLLKHCKYLTYLDLSYNVIADTDIHIISKNLVHLEYLCLKHCGITDYGLTGQRTEHLFLEDTDEREHLFLEDTDEREHLLLEDTDEREHPSLSNLKSLRELNLDNCDEITDKAVIDAIKFEYLELLNVSRCNLKLDTVRILLHQNPCIKKIVWDDNDLEHPEIEKRNMYTDFDVFPDAEVIAAQFDEIYYG